MIAVFVIAFLWFSWWTIMLFSVHRLAALNVSGYFTPNI